MYDAYVGIDPGKKGAIAIIRESSVDVLPFPLAGKNIDIAVISNWLYQKLESNHPVVYIEKVHAMPKQGVSAMFTFGFTAGIMYGIITTLAFPLFEVSPITWKKHVLRDTGKDKDAAIEFCRRAFPTVSLIPKGCRVPHSGIADALCIAYYAFSVIRNDI